MSNLHFLTSTIFSIENKTAVVSQLMVCKLFANWQLFDSVSCQTTCLRFLHLGRSRKKKSSKNINLWFLRVKETCILVIFRAPAAASKIHARFILNWNRLCASEVKISSIKFVLYSPGGDICSHKSGKVTNVRSSRQGDKNLQFLSGCNF